MQELDMLWIVLTISKNIPASPADVMTSKASYENDAVFDLSNPISVSERESFYFETANLRAERNALKEETEMPKMKMSFTYAGIKGDPGKCRQLTELGQCDNIY